MALEYFPSKDKWGLYAKDGELTLVFSGFLNPIRIFKNKISRLLLNPQLPQITGDAVDIFRLFTPEAELVWNRAVWKSINQGSEKSGCMHLFLSLTQDPQVREIFTRLGADLHDARKLLLNVMRLSPASSAVEELRQIPFVAFQEAEKLHSPGITPLMLLAAIVQVLSAEHILQAVFSNLDLTREKVEVLAVWRGSLNYDFPKNKNAQALLHCCQRVAIMEKHNRVFYKLNVIEEALTRSKGETALAMKLLIQAATRAKQDNKKNVTVLI